MTVSIFRCPECCQEVFCKSLEAFRCPVCGFAGGNQLSLFHGGAIQAVGEFSPEDNARAAHRYHYLAQPKRVERGGSRA